MELYLQNDKKKQGCLEKMSVYYLLTVNMAEMSLLDKSFLEALSMPGGIHAEAMDPGLVLGRGAHFPHS